MPDAREWLKRLFADTSYLRHGACEALCKSHDLPSFVATVEVSRQTAPVLENVSEYLYDLSRDAEKNRRPESVWRPTIEARATFLRRLREAFGADSEEFSSLLWGHWDWVVKSARDLGDVGWATDLAIEELEAREGPGSSSMLYDIKKLFPSGSVHGNHQWIERARRVLSAVRAKTTWGKFAKGSACSTAHELALLSGAFDLAADAWETSLRSDLYYTPEWWRQNRTSSAWPCAVALWVRAGNPARAAALAREIGREAKACRLEGKPSYRIEEIDFPRRGDSPSYLIGSILDDDSMVIEALFQQGRPAEAHRGFSKYASGCRPGLVRILRAVGLHELAQSLADLATQQQQAVDAAIRKVDGSLQRAYDYDYHILGPSILRVLEDRQEWSTVVDLLHSEQNRKPESQMARALYHLGRKRDAAREAERLLEQTLKESFSTSGERDLGVALLYEEAGDPASAQRILQAAETRLRSCGRWQEALGMYFDAGRLKDLERVAREEDEPECAIIAYEATDQHAEAARIYEEMSVQSGQTGSGPKHDLHTQGPSAQDSAGERTCPACGYPVETNWVVCPECEAELTAPTCCGRVLKPTWKRCPICGKPVTRL